MILRGRINDTLTILTWVFDEVVPVQALTAISTRETSVTAARVLWMHHSSILPTGRFNVGVIVVAVSQCWKLLSKFQ